MKHLRNTIAPLLLPALLLAACNNQPQGETNDIATPVSVLELKKGSISQLIHTSGTARPVYGADLVAQMSGNYLLGTNPQTGRPFRLGDRLTKGQSVIRLEDEEYVNSIAIHAKELDLEIAEQEQVKQTALYEKGGVTLSEMRNTEVRVTNARYAVENARLNLQKMDIQAPFDGVIVDLPHYTHGVKVEQGKPMLSLMDYGRMYLEVNLPESAISYVKAGQAVHITHYTLPEDTLTGVVDELSPAISAETRTFKGKIHIHNSSLLLRPGMFVKADIVVDKADSSIIIPKEVIQTSRNRKYVYVVEKNTALLRDIRTGLEDETHAQVVDGLKENDNLVVKGFEILRENSKVKVQR
ncbi:MAG: efflux RND transporter periplasmic adaptor subunit [Tannerellaceae bacterium]|jgi:RND family efflux transporter MFP subunit|nr:efflux RND transporter periplasmic adaptor subunit [Tannerellaceae bacterium]